MRPKIGSLFAGVGGLELGVELATGGETVWQVEMEPYARSVLERHWPDADRSVLDVRLATPETLGPIDILVGGFPCQDISTAGKGLGLEGKKSGLFFEMARIVRDFRPNFVVMENVSAITTRGLPVVLGTMAGLGYNARWGVLSAGALGAPHLRRRWYCVCWLPDAYGIGLGDSHRSLGQGQTKPAIHGEAHGMAGLGMEIGARHETTEATAATDLFAPTAMGSSPRGGSGVDDGRGSRPLHPLVDPNGISGRSPGLFGGHETHPGPRLGGGSSQSALDRREALEAEPLLGRASDGFPLRLDSWERGDDLVEPWERGVVRATADKPPAWKDRLRCLGNSVVPQWGYEVGLVLKAIADGEPL